MLHLNIESAKHGHQADYIIPCSLAHAGNNNQCVRGSTLYVGMAHLAPPTNFSSDVGWQESWHNRYLEEFIFRYRVVESSSLVSILFRETFSHPNFSLFSFTIKWFVFTIIIIIIIIIIINLFRRVFSECTEAITTSLIPPLHSYYCLGFCTVFALYILIFFDKS